MPDISAAKAGTVQIGELAVNRIGLGTNRITDTPAAHLLLRRALELDVDFIDTAHRYADGASEVGIGNALHPFAKGLVVATKGGMGNGAAPEVLARELDESLRRLQTDCITLYQLHRVDPAVPIEESVGAMARFRDEGKIKYLGLSEVTVEQLEQAQKIAPIVSVQNHYNVVTRNHEDLVDYCTAHKIVFIPWFPLGGLRGGAEKVAGQLEEMAARYGVAPQQLAIAWLLKRSPIILPIPGTLSVAHLEENVRAASIELSEDDYATLSQMGRP